MQNENSFCKSNQIDCAIRASIKIFYDLEDAGRAESLERTSLLVFPSDLRQEQSVPEDVNNRRRQRVQIALAGPDPVQWSDYWLVDHGNYIPKWV